MFILDRIQRLFQPADKPSRSPSGLPPPRPHFVSLPPFAKSHSRYAHNAGTPIPAPVQPQTESLLFRIVEVCLKDHKAGKSHHASAVTRKGNFRMSDHIVTIATTGVVERGSVRVLITKESIESIAARINEGFAIPLIANHDPFTIPIAKIKDAWVEPFGNEYAVRGHIHTEEVASVEAHSGTGLTLVRLDCGEDSRPFFRRSYEKSDKTELALSVDQANFNSLDDYTRFADEICLIDDSIGCNNDLGRHSQTPEPLIQIIVAHPGLDLILAWLVRRAEKFIRHTLDETLKTVGDYISGVFSTKIIKILSAYTSCKSEDNRSTVVQIIIPDEEVEICLLVKIECGEEFPVICLEHLAGELERVRDIVKDTDKIVLSRTGANRWKFLYATTQSGMIIATQECFENTLDTVKSLE